MNRFVVRPVPLILRHYVIRGEDHWGNPTKEVTELPAPEYHPRFMREVMRRNGSAIFMIWPLAKVYKYLDRLAVRA